MSRSLTINLYLRPCSLAIYGNFYLYCLYIFRLFSSLQIVQIWSKIMHYILEVSKYTNIIYIRVYLVLPYIERLFSSVCYFLSYFCWLVKCMSRVNKFHNFFLSYLEAGARSIFEGFSYCHLWKVQFQVSSTFLAFCIGSVN